MTCEEFARMLDNYDNLTDEERVRMDIHADTCSHCKKELELMRSIIQATKTLPKISVPDDFLAKLNARIDEEEVKEYKKNRYGFVTHFRENWQRYSAVAACMVLAVVIGSNYSTLVTRMDNTTDVVVTDTVPSSNPADADNGTSDAVTASADNQNDVNSSRRNETGMFNIARGKNAVNDTQSEAVNASGQDTADVAASAPANVQSEAQAKAPANNTAASNETAVNTGNDTTTAAPFALKRGVYIEKRSDGTEATPEAQTSGIDDYSITAPDIAVARISGRMMADVATEAEDANDEAAEEESYKLSTNRLVISSDDYGDAMDIIQRYLSGDYNGEYYIVDKTDLGRLLNRLKAEGIGFDDYISDDSNEITFRVVSE